MSKKEIEETTNTKGTVHDDGTNPRIGRMIHLMEEVERQHEKELLRGKRIRQEQEGIDKMLDSMNENLRNNQEERRINEEFELRIKNQVYRMHGISEDKMEGMEETKRAWYQGAAFALLFLSLALTVLCGTLHGFYSEICIFMAFYTAVEGALLSDRRKQTKFLDVITKLLYLLLFPAMMAVFICFELGFREYDFLVPVFVIVGLVILVLGICPYFMYDPYRISRRSRKAANSYLRELEKLALKEVKIKEKELEKRERKKVKQLIKEEKKQQRKVVAQEKKKQRRQLWEERKKLHLTAWKEKKQGKETQIQQAVEVQEVQIQQVVGAQEAMEVSAVQLEDEATRQMKHVEMESNIIQQTVEEQQEEGTDA